MGAEAFVEVLVDRVDRTLERGLAPVDGSTFNLLLERLDARRRERDVMALDGKAEELEPMVGVEILDLVGVF